MDFIMGILPHRHDEPVRLPKRAASERGLSLVETVVMLSVLSILAGSLVPVIFDSVGTARQVRAKNDVMQIAVSIVNFQRDVGLLIPKGTTWTGTRKVNGPAVALLVSTGETPKASDAVAGTSEWLFTPPEPLDGHLRINERGYPSTVDGIGPSWKGPYLGATLAPDPWGKRYMVNTVCLLGGNGSLAGQCAVFALSAGPNGRVETPFLQAIDRANVGGDDIAVRLQ